MSLKTVVVCIIFLNANLCVFAQHVNDTVINLGNEFSIFAAGGECYPDNEEPKYSFTTYTTIRLYRKSKIVFTDTTKEYQFEGLLSPFFRKIGITKYEFLIEVNDRPNMNYFLHLVLTNGNVIHQDTIPGSISNSPKLIYNDGSFELYGLSCDGGVWGDTNSPMTGYNPILYYHFRRNGIVLDTATTIKTNKYIYGKFKGYKWNDFSYPLKIISKKEKELKILQ